MKRYKAKTALLGLGTSSHSYTLYTYKHISNMGLFKNPEKEKGTVSVEPASALDSIQLEGQVSEREYQLQRGLKPRHISVC